DGSQLPREIHGVADAGVHALSAYGTVNVCGIAEQERVVFAEMIGDSMVHIVSREPVHALNVDTHPIDYALADVVPGKIFMSWLGFAYGADEPRMSYAPQREHGQEVGRVQ